MQNSTKKQESLVFKILPPLPFRLFLILQVGQLIERQLRECYDFAERNNFIVIAEYVDRALMGTSDKRPEFLRMVDDSRKKNFDHAVVYQLDRFARSREDSAHYKAKLKRTAYEFYPQERIYPTTQAAF